MKRIKTIFLVLFILIIGSSCQKQKDSFIYSPTYHKIEDFCLEEGERYLILYDTSNKEYYLGKVVLQRLDKDLYQLGKEAHNFISYDEKNNTLILGSKDQTIVCSSQKTIILQEPNDDIKELGLVIIQYDSKTGHQSIIHRKIPYLCSLSFDYYQFYIPIDIIGSYIVE